jgi:excisionase family DNA binding protein
MRSTPTSRSDHLMAPGDVAVLCGLSRKAVYRAIERGELRASRLCSRLRIRASDVDAWIDAHRVQAAVQPVEPRRSPVAATDGLRRLLGRESRGVA